MKAKELLEKYRAGQCSEEELIQLQNWFHQLNLNRNADLTDEKLIEVDQHMWVVIDRETKSKKAKLWPGIAAAVTLVLGVGFGYYAFQYSGSSEKMKVAMQDVLPGGNKAFLVLGNGKRISLTDAKNGNIASQAGIDISKTADGKLVYSIKDNENAISNFSNTIETPEGGQYQIILPDGTLVVLNTSSSITFPASFTSKKERKVVLKGEAYFEVAKSKDKPFKVITALQEVAVLGTHFNINAYQDEDFTLTTLLEGSVKVSKDDAVKYLLPGEQSALNEELFNVRLVDVESVVSWQNGYFSFENESVEAVMRKVARWYNIEVIYKGDFSNVKLLGSVSRNKKLSEVLRVIQLSRKVKFKVEGRRVTVMP